jgi:DNA integrity scanning protein DisA with diadenylate cyclase activity
MFEELSWIKDFITLRDILDIFLVSLVFYLILRLIVRYRGIKILLGLLGLFFLWLVALVFKLLPSVGYCLNFGLYPFLR